MPSPEGNSFGALSFSNLHRQCEASFHSRKVLSAARFISRLIGWKQLLPSFPTIDSFCGRMIMRRFEWTILALFLFLFFISAVQAQATRDGHLVMGNPSGATTSTSNENNYLMSKYDYALSYNRSRATCNWVSWHLSSAWLGSASRQDDFRADTTLPSGWYRVGAAPTLAAASTAATCARRRTGPIPRPGTRKRS